MIPLKALLASASLVVSLAAAAAQAQAPAEQPFDPAHPFAGLAAPQAWAKRFATGKPSFDAHDPWGNFTARDWNNQGFFGDHADDPGTLLDGDEFSGSYSAGSIRVPNIGT